MVRKLRKIIKLRRLWRLWRFLNQDFALRAEIDSQFSWSSTSALCAYPQLSLYAVSTFTLWGQTFTLCVNLQFAPLKVCKSSQLHPLVEPQLMQR
jgi:hypothetical protein